MIQENEIIMLILGFGVFIFILGNLRRILRVPHRSLLMLGFYVFLLGWVLTVLEAFLWGPFLNYLEHVCYAAGSVSLALWCWRTFRTSSGIS